MAPQEIKQKIQSAYNKATSQHNVFSYSNPSAGGYIFHNVTLFGREAGIDFVGTRLKDFVQAAVEAAEINSASLEISAHGFGARRRSGYG